VTVTENPLLAAEGLPRFDLIGPEHVQPGMSALLDELEAAFERFEAEIEPTWESAVDPLERLGDRLQHAWGVVGHLMGVKNSDALREAHEAVQPRVVTLGIRMGQSRPLYDALCTLRDGPGWSALDPAQQRIVESLLRDARLSGVGLEDEARERFNAIQLELAELATHFNNHVLDGTKAFALTLHSADEAEGLPESLLQLGAQLAREAGEQEAGAEAGPWRIGLDAPCYIPFMEHARRRDLRETLYRAYVTRASSGELDNVPIIRKILALRREEARLLGFADFAEVSLSSKMAPDVPAVERLLEELRGASLEAAGTEVEELRALARQQDAPEGDDFQLWDVLFWSERLRESRYAYSDEELRPWFPFPKVLEGLFALANRLFDVSITAADGEVPVWHADVRFFRVCDARGEPIAGFYLDPYSRPGEKRGGAWMDECVGRSRLLAPEPGGVRLPVAYLVCNQAPPTDGKPSLMSFGEAETLFHEFGHGLQHMLTRVEYGLAAGIRNVEWDAVELPSQFMENWLYERDVVRGISGHVDSGEPLPDASFEKIRAARNHLAGYKMLRQLFLTKVDLALHHGYDPEGGEPPHELQRRIAEWAGVLPPLPEDRFLCSFGHIFGGGYAAGYYSYKWAEVLSADAFAAFEEAGLDEDEALRETGRRYRETVLALGGSRSPMEVFTAFRGREPTTEALLRHSGLLRAGG
jgi:oligopeptidase A